MIFEQIETIEKEQYINPRFAVFDFDNTCIANDIQQAFVAHICRHRLIRDKTLMYDPVLAENIDAYHEAFFRHYYGLLSKGVTRDAFVFLLRSLTGFRTSEMDALVANIIQEQGTELGKDSYLGIEITKGLRLRKVVADLMQECVARRIAVYVISASPEALVSAALRYYALPVTACLGIQLLEREGVFLNELIEPMPVEDGKIICIQKYIHPETRPLLGVGDSMNDFGMLMYSLTQAVVDRENELAHEGKFNHWNLLPY